MTAIDPTSAPSLEGSSIPADPLGKIAMAGPTTDDDSFIFDPLYDGDYNLQDLLGDLGAAAGPTGAESGTDPFAFLAGGGDFSSNPLLKHSLSASLMAFSPVTPLAHHPFPPVLPFPPLSTPSMQTNGGHYSKPLFAQSCLASPLLSPSRPLSTLPPGVLDSALVMQGIFDDPSDSLLTGHAPPPNAFPDVMAAGSSDLAEAVAAAGALSAIDEPSDSVMAQLLGSTGQGAAETASSSLHALLAASPFIGHNHHASIPLPSATANSNTAIRNNSGSLGMDLGTPCMPNMYPQSALFSPYLPSLLQSPSLGHSANSMLLSPFVPFRSNGLPPHLANPGAWPFNSPKARTAPSPVLPFSGSSFYNGLSAAQPLMMRSDMRRNPQRSPAMRMDTWNQTSTGRTDLPAPSASAPQTNENVMGPPAPPRVTSLDFITNSGKTRKRSNSSESTSLVHKRPAAAAPVNSTSSECAPSPSAPSTSAESSSPGAAPETPSDSSKVHLETGTGSSSSSAVRTEGEPVRRRSVRQSSVFSVAEILNISDDFEPSSAARRASQPESEFVAVLRTSPFTPVTGYTSAFSHSPDPAGFTAAPQDYHYAVDNTSPRPMSSVATSVANPLPNEGQPFNPIVDPTKPFPCPHPTCAKSFSTREKLRIHGKSHRTSRKHECTVCHKFFLRRQDLERHAVRHAPEKQFACEMCGTLFTRKDARQRHVKGRLCAPKTGAEATAAAGNAASVSAGIGGEVQAHAPPLSMLPPAAPTYSSPNSTAGGPPTPGFSSFYSQNAPAPMPVSSFTYVPVAPSHTPPPLHGHGGVKMESVHVTSEHPHSTRSMSYGYNVSEYSRDLEASYALAELAAGHAPPVRYVMDQDDGRNDENGHAGEGSSNGVVYARQ